MKKFLELLDALEKSTYACQLERYESGKVGTEVQEAYEKDRFAMVAHVAAMESHEGDSGLMEFMTQKVTEMRVERLEAMGKPHWLIEGESRYKVGQVLGWISEYKRNQNK